MPFSVGYDSDESSSSAFKKLDVVDESLFDISKKLKSILSDTDLNNIANILSEEDVISEEKRKIGEVLALHLAEKSKSRDDKEAATIDETSSDNAVNHVSGTDNSPESNRPREKAEPTAHKSDEL